MMRAPSSTMVTSSWPCPTLQYKWKAEDYHYELLHCKIGNQRREQNQERMTEMEMRMGKEEWKHILMSSINEG